MHHLQGDQNVDFGFSKSKTSTLQDHLKDIGKSQSNENILRHLAEYAVTDWLSIVYQDQDFALTVDNSSELHLPFIFSEYL